FDEAVEPIVTVGKRLTPRLYVETLYHHNAPPETNEKEVRARYRFAPKWSLETSYGDAGQGLVELYWTTRFGGGGDAENDAIDAGN
ncbi:MAG: translocation/assembly module TamB domain-containing protein, partial [Myxococcales bacterium]|nr:translocation/assembly module TamB domain-containing protein [Myxococcales bacterium]